MLPDLSSANWKIDRALELLNGLDAEVIAWHGTNPAGFAVYVNPEFTRLSVTVKVKDPPPTTKWSLVYADIVHNLRCALDHALWALLQNEFPSGIPPDVERLSFPIWDSPPTANQRRNFQPVSSKLFAAIESVQPYNQPFTQFPIHPLAIIRDIDNGNKHRLLFSLVHSIARFHVPITNVRHPQGNSHSSDIYRGELTDDVEIMAITFDIPEPYMKYDGIEFVSIIAVRHPTANLSGKDRDDYAALTDTLVVWVRKTIADLVAAAV